MANLTSSSIRLDGQTYNLARNEDVRRVLGASGRRWNVARKRVATKRIPRPDVRPGDIEGEWIITWDDWSKGIAGDHENLPGCYHYGENVECGIPGSIRGVGVLDTVKDVTNDWETPPVAIVQHTSSSLVPSQLTYIAGPRQVWRWYGNAVTMTALVNLGAGKSSTDAIEHNNTFILANGESDDIRSYAIDESATTGTGIRATHFAIVEGRLNKAASGNEVSSIGPTDVPTTAANWSTAITVGDDDRKITRLNAYGERLAVSKEEGLFLSEQTELLFANVLPNITPHPDNGKATIVRGSDIFYNTPTGLLRYNRGAVEDIGIDQIFRSAGLDFGSMIPSTRITAACTDGDDIYIATGPSFFPRADPTGFLKTTNNESSFTSLLANVIDNDIATYSDASIDTAANGDYFYIGYSSPFYGVVLDFSWGNLSPAVLTGQYWTGAAWSNLYAVTAGSVPQTLHDGTSLGGPTGATMGQPGVIQWTVTPGDWATKNINGTTTYWVRFSVSAVISGAYVVEARIVTAQPSVYVFRGRARQRDDVRNGSIVWHSLCFNTTLIAPEITAMTVLRPHAPYKRTKSLIMASQQNVVEAWLFDNAFEGPLDGTAGKLYLQRHDGGMPEVNKQFLDMTIKGKKIDADHTVDLHFNLNEQTTTWTAVATNINSSPSTTTLSSITGYAIQPRITIDDFSHDEVTEINELECRFRELPTYKNEYTMILELADGQIDAEGVMLPDASVQLSNLEGDHGAAAVALIDPLTRSKTVTVHSVQEIEYLQDGVDYPRLLVECRCTEI